MGVRAWFTQTGGRLSTAYTRGGERVRGFAARFRGESTVTDRAATASTYGDAGFDPGRRWILRGSAALCATACLAPSSLFAAPQRPAADETFRLRAPQESGIALPETVANSADTPPSIAETTTAASSGFQVYANLFRLAIPKRSVAEHVAASAFTLAELYAVYKIELASVRLLKRHNLMPGNAGLLQSLLNPQSLTRTILRVAPRTAFVAACGIVGLAAPLIEEFIFRLGPGLLCNNRPGSLRPSVCVVSALAFAYAHNLPLLKKGPRAFIRAVPLPQFELGLYLATLMGTRGIDQAILAHVVHNCVPLAGLGVALRKQDWDFDALMEQEMGASDTRTAG